MVNLPKLDAPELKSLEGVEVYFISDDGAPEVEKTNSDGYVQIRIPKTGDIDIKLSKKGFQTLTRTINLKIEPNRTRTYQLKNISSTETNAPFTNSPSPFNLPPKSTRSALVEQSVSICTLVSGYNDKSYSKDISVARQPQKPESRIFIKTGSPNSLTCRITQNTGILAIAYAIPDNSRLQQARVSFYLDGKFFQTLNISRSSVERVTLDVTNASNYAIDYQLISGNNDYLYTISTSAN